MALVQIVDSDSKGKILLTTSDIKAGGCVLEEEPLMLVRKRPPKPDDPFTALSAQLQIALNFFLPVHVFFRLPADKQEAVLQLFCPAAELKRKNHHLSKLRDALQDPAVVLPYDKDTTFRVLAIFEFNSLESASGFAIYANICRISHSCMPNCHWYYDERDKRIVRATRALSAGEEVTCSYLPEELLLRPKPMRTKVLEERMFTCICNHCTSFAERWQLFLCKNCSVGGPMLHHSDTEPLRCENCGDVPPDAVQEMFLTMEHDITMQFTKMQLKSRFNTAAEFASYMYNVRKVIARAKTLLHAHHWVVAELRYLLYECLRQPGVTSQPLASVEHLTAYIDHLDRVYPQPLPLRCWRLLDQAELLTTLKRPAEAAAALHRAAMELTVLYGRDGPYIKKLLGLWGSLQCCGAPACGRDAGDSVMQVCGKCKMVKYCNTQCQQNHWRAGHKSYCVAADS
eukprot:TRINITY_DN15246_c0_g1_i1.p1 TRINITY_DN15246_c0_g1~~TRINITY_DN15246_c0_g1_i1.p1  ORF type:complete len:471 (-),score=115.53 TRINITY_DN15246_c0_g1_i1:9-1376(-)